MKIIALFGNSDTGKTTTLNLTFKELLNRGYVIETFNQAGANADDFKTTLVKNGVKVGIVTVGDFEVEKKINSEDYNEGCRTFKQYIDEFALENCHKVILAISKNLNKVNIINNHLPDFNYQVIKSVTQNPHLQSVFNIQDMNTILTLLDS